MTDRRDDENVPDEMGRLFGVDGSEERAAGAPSAAGHASAPATGRLRLTRGGRIAIGVGIAFVLVVVIVAIVITAVNAANAPTRIESAVTYCGLEDNAYASVAEGGRSVALDTTGAAEVEGLDAADLVCVLVEVGISDEALEAMSSTGTADGPQTAEWDGFTAGWEYRDDAGLDVQLTQK